MYYPVESIIHYKEPVDKNKERSYRQYVYARRNLVLFLYKHFGFFQALTLAALFSMCPANREPGNFKIMLWDNRSENRTYGNCMVVEGGEDTTIIVIVPPGVVHGYKNISDKVMGMVLNYPDKLY